MLNAGSAAMIRLISGVSRQEALMKLKHAFTDAQTARIPGESMTDSNVNCELNGKFSEKAGLNDRILIIVKTGRNESKITNYSEDNETFSIDLKARPIENKANIELLNFLKKITGRRFEIASGKTSRKKIVRPSDQL